MDTQRLILFLVFSFSLLFLWQEWQKEHRPVVPAAPTSPLSAPAPSAPGTAPAAPGASVVPAVNAPQSGQRVHVRTDTMVAEIATQGGDLVYLELLQHKDTLDGSKNLVLLGPEHRYSAQSGLTGGLPFHRTLYTTAELESTLAPGKDKLEVRLEASAPDGVKVTKILTFHRASYQIAITEEIRNGTASPISTFAYFQLTRDIDKGKLPSKKSNDGWIAIVQHYFVAALLPPDRVQRDFYASRLAEDFYSVGVKIPVGPIAPGATESVAVALYAGPQYQDNLDAVAPGLQLVVDYGNFKMISEPLFWVLKFFHGWMGNWGLAIILLTVVIKLIFFPLSAASYRSMAKMKLVTPRLMKLREQHADDKAKMNQAMMELYKTEKINPLGGCLPILVQIPVFIALYWVLFESVELRDAPFYLWIRDLSAPDPWYVLPTLMMASMLVQTKMNPTPPDPVQAKVMMIMPFAFGVMFYFFPSGLVLYWFVNNILSILQQWQITRMIGGEKAAASAKR
jgi:YidC/Oxa1 family membrane protein insertase